MSTKKAPEKNEVPTAIYRKVPFYKKASFPWAIIIIAVVASSSFISGWHMKSLDDNRIKAEAAHIVQLSKAEQ